MADECGPPPARWALHRKTRGRFAFLNNKNRTMKSHAPAQEPSKPSVNLLKYFSKNEPSGGVHIPANRMPVQVCRLGVLCLLSNYGPYKPPLSGLHGEYSPCLSQQPEAFILFLRVVAHSDTTSRRKNSESTPSKPACPAGYTKSLDAKIKSQPKPHPLSCQLSFPC